MAEPSVTLFGPLDALVGPYAEYVVLVLVLANLVTRKLGHDAHVRQAREGGEEAVERYTPHWVTNVLLVLASFYYLTLHHHAGIVLSTLVLGAFIADVFEFEARLVEARNDMDLESPNGAITASVLVLLYSAYLSLFFLVEPIWNAIV